MPVLYMDLDGTIIDVWTRYYSVMRLFFERNSTLSFPTLQEYKQLKLSLIKDEAVIRYLFQGSIPSENEFVRDYQLYKQTMLESEQMLSMDTVIGQLHAFVAQLKPEYKLHLVSVRRNQELALRQLHHLRITKLLDELDFVFPSREYNPKWELLKNRASRHDVIVGDSETDIACGQMLQLQTFHVSTGLRSYDCAIQYGPAIRLNSYSDLLSFLTSSGSTNGSTYLP